MYTLFIRFYYYYIYVRTTYASALFYTLWRRFIEAHRWQSGAIYVRYAHKQSWIQYKILRTSIVWRRYQQTSGHIIVYILYPFCTRSPSIHTPNAHCKLNSIVHTQKHLLSYLSHKWFHINCIYWVLLMLCCSCIVSTAWSMLYDLPSVLHSYSYSFVWGGVCVCVYVCVDNDLGFRNEFAPAVRYAHL